MIIYLFTQLLLKHSQVDFYTVRINILQVYYVH